MNTFLFLAALTVLLLVWSAASRPRQWLNIPAARQARRASFLSRTIVRIPLTMWFLIAAGAALALTNPKRTTTQSFIEVQRKIFVFCVDVSTSMGQGPGSTMERIKAVYLDFADRRAGDVMGVSAYSGSRYPPRGKGYARVILQPSDDLTQVKAAITATRYQMFGIYTATGDGIFVSALALIEDDAKRAMGDGYDRTLLEMSVDSMGETTEDLWYAQKVAEAIGPQEGKFILLFTDGKYNTGLHPSKALWFCRRIGLKVHFIAYESSAATGLSEAEQIAHQMEVAQAVMETGGLFLPSNNLDAMAEIMERVHKAEPQRVVLGSAEKTVDLRYPLYIFMAVCMGIWLVTEFGWPKFP